MRALIIASAIALIVPSTLNARDRFPPEEGTRVRILAPRQFLYLETGEVTESNKRGVSISLDEYGETVHVPYFDVARLEVSRGETKATLWGALGGAVLGAAVGMATTPVHEPYGFDDFHRSDEDVFGRMMLGAVVGGAFGGLIGSAITIERWEPVFTARRRF